MTAFSLINISIALHSIRKHLADTLILSSLVSHRISLSFYLPLAAVVLFNSVRNRRVSSLTLAPLVSHRISLSLHLPQAAVEFDSSQLRALPFPADGN